MSDDPHAVALLALLEAGVPQTVYDGAAPNPMPARPYVLAYISVATPEESSIEGSSDVTTARLYAHCVGDNAQAARTVAKAVRDALLNATPTIEGRTVNPIRHEDSRAPERDETTGTLVMDAVDVYALTSWPG